MRNSSSEMPRSPFPSRPRRPWWTAGRPPSGMQIDSRRLAELATNGRNIIALAGTLPGVTSVSAPQTFTGDRSGPTLSVSGSRGNQNLFLFDGQQFNAVFRNTGLNYPPPDALQEVKVLTNSFTAEYGRNAGAVFNVVKIGRASCRERV